MNNTVENDFFGFPKLKWLQYTGKVGKCTSCRCQMLQKSLKSVFFDRVIGKIKRGPFFGTQCKMQYNACESHAEVCITKLNCKHHHCGTVEHNSIEIRHYFTCDFRCKVYMQRMNRLTCIVHCEP